MIFASLRNPETASTASYNQPIKFFSFSTHPCLFIPPTPEKKSDFFSQLPSLLCPSVPLEKQEMALSIHVFIFLLISSFSVLFVRGENQYKVGGDEGWRVPDDNNPDFYTNWASKLRFQVGDSIVFEYKNDSVIRVEKRGYYHCNESVNGSVFQDGRTVFLLDKPGLFYFVSSNFEHCKKGQRLMVDVMTSHRPPFPGAPGPSPASSAAPFTSYVGSVTVFAVAFSTLLTFKWALKDWEAAAE